MSILRFNNGKAPKRAGRAKIKNLLPIGALVAVFALGSTLAANINLNGNTAVEFGQGVAQTTACDSQILVTPISTFQNDEESGFMFSGLGLSGVDTTDQTNSSEGCAGKIFTIKAYDGSGNLLTPTYTIAVRANGNFISEDGSASTGIGNDTVDYSTLNFDSPTILAEDVFRITIESSIKAGCYGSNSGLDGLTEQTAAVSGNELAQDCPDFESGLYWIKSESMPNALQMYVDMVEDGGGYDFYFITEGPSVNSVTEPNGGTELGLDLVMPRSKYHWRAMKNAVINGRTSGDFDWYFQTSYGVYRNTQEFGGVFTTVSMNSSDPIAGQAWRVKDGGRWWLRDTTFGEPNGDYILTGLLLGGMYESWDLQDLGFNDGGWYNTGSYYLVSTNAKP